MIQLGTVTGQEIKPNRGTDINLRMLQVQLGTDAQSNPETVEYIPLSGDDNPPMKDDRVVVFGIGSAFKIAIGVRDLVVTVMNPGERKLYSRDGSGDIAAFINLLNGGNIELNGNGDFAVRFQALQDKLESLENQLVMHVHPGVTTGAGSTGMSVTAFDTDISAAKVDEVTVTA